MTQKQALEILKTGDNVFLTGPAGSGKTYVVNQYISYLKGHGVPIGITASTGIAATHLGGITIHAWSGIGIRDSLSGHDLETIGEKTQVRKRLENTKVLLIDEVSMLHHYRLDLVDQILRHLKKNEKPFGGLQIVLCGDFFQLPPVSKMGEPAARFIYESKSWKQSGFRICYLSENYRQTDDVSISILNEIRAGKVSELSWERLQSRFHRKLDQVQPTRLFTHNIDVDAVNENELKKVPENESVYEMSSKGKKPLVEYLKKSCLAPEILRLKKGARVMCVKNNFEKGYVNGTLGVVVSCGPGVDPVISTVSSVEYPQGRGLTLALATWTIEDDGKVLAQIEQYPLRLAWAITVHKSQGMSLDALEVDLSKSFEPGMGYVALSRARSFEGISILGLNGQALRVHPEVLEFDGHLRELSAKDESVLTYTDQAEIKRKQDEFLARVAPLHALRGRRSIKISTYEKTLSLLLQGKSLGEMAKDRKLNPETIISHIEELMKSGEKIEVSYLRKEISFPHWQKIEKALEEVALAQNDDKPPLLSPVKSKVGLNISFKEIRLARVLLGYVGKNS